MICILILLILITISSLPLGMWTCGAWAKALATKGKAQAVDHGLAALTNLIDYFEFISITPRKHDGILDTLLHNDIDNYQMLESLSIDELKALGFNVGVISKLRSNVGKYQKRVG
ncbi:hypothetical protein KEM48_010072 [Puccinia striiformis f. sp. tritici PST-130]|nr:hypothetical protein KEM48_010072 [Puccinia striiformis f. sp. tritici PST-130]